MKRNRQERWDKAHMHTVSTRMTVGEWMKFKTECAAEGVTPYALILRMLREWMEESVLER